MWVFPSEEVSIRSWRQHWAIFFFACLSFLSYCFLPVHVPFLFPEILAILLLTLHNLFVKCHSERKDLHVVHTQRLSKGPSSASPHAKTHALKKQPLHSWLGIPVHYGVMNCGQGNPISSSWGPSRTVSSMSISILNTFRWLFIVIIVLNICMVWKPLFLASSFEPSGGISNCKQNF